MDGGLASQPAPQAELVRSGRAIQRQLLPEVAQVMALSDGGGDERGGCEGGPLRRPLLGLLLTLAHQRSNGKLVARMASWCMTKAACSRSARPRSRGW